MQDHLTHLIAAVLAGAHARLQDLGLPADGALTWSLSIVTLVVAVRLALLPAVIHGVRQAHAAARARPELSALQQRYAGRTDPEAVRELLAGRRAVQARHGSSRLGCLPLLLQLPILFALYAVLSAVAQRQPLGAMDAALVASAGSASVLGVSLADRWGDALVRSPGHVLLVWGLAALAAALSYATQRYAVMPNLSVDGMPAAFAQVRHMMPALSAAGVLVSGALVPVGLLIYWVAANGCSLAQQLAITRWAPTPGTPAHAAHAARRAHQARRAAG